MTLWNRKTSNAKPHTAQLTQVTLTTFLVTLTAVLQSLDGLVPAQQLGIARKLLMAFHEFIVAIDCHDTERVSNQVTQLLKYVLEAESPIFDIEIIAQRFLGAGVAATRTSFLTELGYKPPGKRGSRTSGRGRGRGRPRYGGGYGRGRSNASRGDKKSSS